MTVKEYISEYGKEFHDTFQQSLDQYLDSLAFLGIPSFDIIKFDDYLHRLGYTEKEHGSMKEYMKQKYGAGAVRLMNKLIKVED